MRTIEDADDAWGWQFALDPPEVRMFSSSVGALKALILTPWGSTIPIACRITPPLPEVSIPCRITKTFFASASDTRPLAKSRSCRSLSSGPSASVKAGASAFVPGKPGVPLVSRSRGRPNPQAVEAVRSTTESLPQVRPAQRPAHPFFRAPWAGFCTIRVIGGVTARGRVLAMRLLYDRSDPTITGEISDDRLVELYRHRLPQTGAAAVRTNFISSLDGSVQGPNGRSGSINTPSDHHVFAVQRALADVRILVGAGTVRKEGYRAVDLAPGNGISVSRKGLRRIQPSPW